MKFIKTLNQAPTPEPIVINASEIRYINVHDKGNTNIDIGLTSFSAASSESMKVVYGKVIRAGVKLITFIAAGHSGNPLVRINLGDTVHVNPEKILRILINNSGTVTIGLGEDDIPVRGTLEEVMEVICSSGVDVEVIS